MEKLTWYYHFTWKLKDESRVYTDQTHKNLIEWCHVFNGTLLHSEIILDELKVACTTSHQINLNKAFKGLKQVEKELGPLSLVCSICKPLEKGLQDQRISKILDTLWSVGYYDLDECATEDIEQFKAFLKQRDLATIDIGEQLYLVDTKGLKQEINLNCFECTKVYAYGCCCGSPCQMSRKNQKMLEAHLDKLSNEMKSINETYYNEVITKGGFITFDGIIKSCGERCSLLVEHEGIHKCMVHKYALDEGIPIYEICPLSCLMYPLEILELVTNKKRKIILLTSVVEEDLAKNYGRWGSYKEIPIEHRCVRKETHNETFKKEAYRPVYEVNEELINHELGIEVYKGLKVILDN